MQLPPTEILLRKAILISSDQSDGDTVRAQISLEKLCVTTPWLQKETRRLILSYQAHQPHHIRQGYCAELLLSLDELDRRERLSLMIHSSTPPPVPSFQFASDGDQCASRDELIEMCHVQRHALAQLEQTNAQLHARLQTATALGQPRSGIQSSRKAPAKGESGCTDSGTMTDFAALPQQLPLILPVSEQLGEREELIKRMKSMLSDYECATVALEADCANLKQASTAGQYGAAQH